MELLQMKYFLAVAREESITKAAEFLFITQPSLTRQIQNMENEVGQHLFIRGSRKMVLTETGHLLRKRAEEILALYEKTATELLAPHGSVAGEVFIGGGETFGMSFLIDVFAEMRTKHPDVKINLQSGDMADICERLDKGLIDFGLLLQPADLTKYENIRLPFEDDWGLLMHKSHPLAKKAFIEPEDLKGVPVLQSRNSLPKSVLTEWYKPTGGVEIAGTYNLLRNAAYFAEKQIGCVLCIDKLLNTTGDSSLTFRPLYPAVKIEMDVVWKKYQVFSKAAGVFLNHLRKKIEILTDA